MKAKILFLSLLPIIIFAADGKNYDIIERTLNFLLFFGILLYFIAKPLKQLYLDRIKKIADRLENIQEKLRASKSKKDDVLKRVEEAKINAGALIETARKEAEILSQKVQKESVLEIVNLEKSFKEQQEFEERKMTKSVVNEILNEIFASDSVKVDQKELVNIILKKVS